MDLRIPTPNQDLLQQVKPEKEPLPRGFFTLIAIEVLSVILAGAAGFAAKMFMEGNWGMYAASAFWLAFFPVSALGTFFSPTRWRRMLIVGLETIAFVLFFVNQDPRLTLSAAAITFIFSEWGDEAARREMTERLRIRLLPVSRLKIGRAFTGFLLGGIILSVPFWPSSGIPLGPKQFRSFYDGTVGVAGSLYPGIKLNSTVGELAQGLVKQQLAPGAQFGELPPEVQDQQVRNAAGTMISQASKSLGINFTASDRVSDVFYTYLTMTIQSWKENLGNGFIALWAVAIFIFLRGLGAILVWLAMFVCLAIFELMSAFGIFAMVGEPSMKEKLVISKG